MSGCERFARSLLAHLDGELRGAEAEAARAHEAACPPCGARAAAEREFEERVSAALLGASDGAADVVARGVGRARAPVTRLPGGSAVAWFRRPALRRAAAVAAVALVAVQAAWFFCIPPFECSYLQAVEETAEGLPPAPALATPSAAPCIERLCPAEALGPYRLQRAERTKVVVYGWPIDAKRAEYTGPDGPLTVIWCDGEVGEPSFRRRVERGGRTWWIASENGRSIVAWMCPVTETLCTLVAAAPEERLLALAETVRQGER